MNQSTGKGMSATALVLGIVSIVFFWVPYFNIVTVICGVVGIVLAVMGSKKAKAAGAKSGLATAGLVLSIIGVVLSAIGLFSCTICGSYAVCAAADTAAGLSTLY